MIFFFPHKYSEMGLKKKGSLQLRLHHARTAFWGKNGV